MMLYVVLVAFGMASAPTGRDTVFISIRGNDGDRAGERLHVGQMTRLMAEVLISTGAGARDCPGARLTWESSAPDIASVDTVGHVVARAPGRAIITATAHAVDSTGRRAEGVQEHMIFTIVPVDMADAQLALTTVAAAATSDAWSICALDTAGRALCWGSNADTTVDGHKTILPPGDTRFVSLHLGSGFACATDQRGVAYCWGSDFWGTLGDGAHADRELPASVAGGHRFRMLSTGHSHVCGVTTDDAVYCWGINGNRELGGPSADRCKFHELDNPRVDSLPCSRRPILVRVGEPVREVAVGDDHSCALTQASHVYCWGEIFNINFSSSQPARIRVGSIRLVSLTSGSRHLCGLDADGNAYCWGRDWHRQLGTDGLHSEVGVIGPVADGHHFRSLSLGDDHSCGIATDGSAWCWGSDYDGQLGAGLPFEDEDRPTRVATDGRYTAIGAGYGHTCAIDTHGGLDCWGCDLGFRVTNALKNEPEPFHLVGR
jgi:alpha-tubulin suppressor-like RCC1 family protein